MVSPIMGNPFSGLMEGAQAYQGLMDAYRAPQLQQLQLLQEQAKLQQMQGLDPVSQSQIAAREAQMGLAQRQEDRLQSAQDIETEQSRTMAFGRLAKIYESLPEEQRDQFLIDTKPFHGLDPSQVNPEMVRNLSSAYDAISPKKTTVGRFRQSVVGGNLILLDSMTGQQQVMNLTPGMEPPESFTDEQKNQWKSLSPEAQEGLIKKQLDPNIQMKQKEKLTQIKKKDQFKKIGIELIDSILKNKELPNVLGPIEGNIDFRLEESEAELIQDIKELENILTGENLDLMTGVLSESDIAMLRQIGAGGISRVRSEKEFIKRINSLRESLSSAGTDDLSSELEELEKRVFGK